MSTKQTRHLEEAELDEFKKLLGDEIAGRYTDGELLQLRRDMHELAELLLDIFLAKPSRSVRRG